MWSDHTGRWEYSDEPETHEGAHPSPRHVLDPTIGADGGGHPGVTPLVTFDADGHDGPSQQVDDTVRRLPAVETPSGTAVCDHCGSVVARDRLRG